MKDLIITAVIKVYQYDELNEADQALVKTIPLIRIFQ